MSLLRRQKMNPNMIRRPTLTEDSTTAEEVVLTPSGWDSDSESEDCNEICGTKEVVLTPSGWDSDSDSDSLFPEKDCNGSKTAGELAFEEELALYNLENEMLSKPPARKGTNLNHATKYPVPNSSTENDSKARVICVMPRGGHTIPTLGPVTRTEKVGKDLVRTVSICVSPCVSERVPNTKAKVEASVTMHSKVVRNVPQQVAPTMTLTELSLQREAEYKASKLDFEEELSKYNQESRQISTAEICGIPEAEFNLICNNKPTNPSTLSPEDCNDSTTAEEAVLTPSGWDSDSESEDCNEICGTKEVVLTPSGWDSDSDSDSLFPEKDCNDICGIKETSGWDSDSDSDGEVVEFFGENKGIEPEAQKLPATLSPNASCHREEDCNMQFEAVTEPIQIRVNSPDMLEDDFESSDIEMEADQNLDAISEPSRQQEVSPIDWYEDEEDQCLGVWLARARIKLPPLTHNVEGIAEAVSPKQMSPSASINTTEDTNTVVTSPVPSLVVSEGEDLTREKALSSTTSHSPPTTNHLRNNKVKTESISSLNNADFEFEFDHKKKKWRTVKVDERPSKWWSVFQRGYLKSKASKPQQMREEIGDNASGYQCSSIRRSSNNRIPLPSEEIKMAASESEENDVKAKKKRKGLFKIFSKSKKESTKSPNIDEAKEEVVQTKAPSLMKRMSHFGRKN